jgi:hypothetical protein
LFSAKHFTLKIISYNSKKYVANKKLPGQMGRGIFSRLTGGHLEPIFAGTTHHSIPYEQKNDYQKTDLGRYDAFCGKGCASGYG